MEIVVQNLIKLLDDQKTYLIILNNKVHLQTDLDTQYLQDIQKVVIAAYEDLKKLIL